MPWGLAPEQEWDAFVEGHLRGAGSDCGLVKLWQERGAKWWAKGLGPGEVCE